MDVLLRSLRNLCAAVSTGQCNIRPTCCWRDRMTRSRNRLSSKERQDLWGWWKEGQTLAQIGEALDRAKSTVYTVLQRAGGVAPRTRCRAARHLSAAEREEISRGLVAGAS